MSGDSTDEEYSTDEEITLRSGKTITRRVKKTRRVRRVTVATMTGTFKKKGLSRWNIEGLDVNDSGFSKMHSKEMRFEETTKKRYDLQKETFLNWTQGLIEKVDRIYGRGVFTIQDSSATPEDCFVLTEYTKLTQGNIEAKRDERWPDTDPTFSSQSNADKFCDIQIKSSTIGAYIHDSLTTEAKQQLKADESLFKVKDDTGNHFFDGPSYFWKISEIVDPNNDALVEGVRTQLRNLDVKNYGYSVIQMLAEFKNLRTRVKELGGSYTDDEQFLDLWQCLKTMKERQFADYVKKERDIYREKQKATRDTVDQYISKFSRKETAMKMDDEWNAISPEDSMIMALVSMIEQKSSNTKNKNIKKKDSEKKVSQKDKENEEPKKQLTDEERAKRKDSRYPEWKKTAPKDGESKEKIVNERTYYWCQKCRGGKGLWTFHKVHNSNFVPKTGKPGNSKDEKKDKSVSFAKGTKKSDDGEPSITVNKELLQNAKSYLARVKDFQKGGTQG